jgi:hypothetical protein
MTTPDGIHSCSYFCHFPACIKAQRDELRERATVKASASQVPAGWQIRGWLTETYSGEEMLWPTKKEADLHTDEDRPAIALYAPPIIAIEPEVKE